MAKKYLSLMVLFLIVTVAILVDFGVLEHTLRHAQYFGGLVGTCCVFGKELSNLARGGNIDQYDIAVDVCGVILPVLFAFGL